MSKKQRSNQFTESSHVAVFRLQTELLRLAKEKAREEDITFSQLMRRAIRKEVAMTTK